jgi:subtilase family serine protease
MLVFGGATTIVASAAMPAPTIIATVPGTPVRDLGHVAPTTSIRLAVVLRYRNESDLRALREAQDDAASPLAGRFLTSEQFRDAFAPAPYTYASTMAALQHAGFTIRATSSNRTVIDVIAPAAIVERYFQTSIHQVQQTGVGARYENVAPAYLPSGLQSAVYGVIGFNNLELSAGRGLRPTNAATAISKATTSLEPPVFGPDAGFSPYGFAKAYDFPVNHQRAGAPKGQTYDGTGRATGVVTNEIYSERDLAAFLNYFGIKRTGPPTTFVDIDLKNQFPRVDADYTTMDAETVVGTTPGTALYLYVIPDFVTSWIIDAYNRAASENAVDALSSGFFGCESELSDFARASNHIAEQAAAEGSVWSAFSGDEGAFLCANGTKPGVATPASGPSFVGVGGTTLITTPAGAWRAEWGFAWPGGGLFSAPASSSGGGVSTLFPLPTYQQGVTNIIGTRRNVPDVGFDVSEATGASLYFQGSWSGPIGAPFDGEGLSSDLFCSEVTQIDDVRGSRLGPANAKIYRIFKQYGYTGPSGKLFNDAVGYGNGLYKAIPGYDRVTGIGSIDGWNFAQLVK